jgi:hypothetical protein
MVINFDWRCFEILILHIGVLWWSSIVMQTYDHGQILWLENTIVEACHSQTDADRTWWRAVLSNCRLPSAREEAQEPWKSVWVVPSTVQPGRDHDKHGSCFTPMSCTYGTYHRGLYTRGAILVTAHSRRTSMMQNFRLPRVAGINLRIYLPWASLISVYPMN